MSDTQQERLSETRPKLAQLLANVEISAPKPTVGAGANKNKANSEYRGRRVREGNVLLASRKIFEKRYLVLWENKELVIYQSKPYNDRSTFKALAKLTPAGSFFFLTSKEHPFCFEIHQEQTFRFSCSAEDREKWATVLLRVGLRLVLGPGKEESQNVKNLVATLPQLQRLENKVDSSSLQGLCVECDSVPAEVICDQCEDAYCNKCFEAQHRSGKRATHTTQLLGRGSSSRNGIDIVELYSHPFPFLFSDLLEHIPTMAEVDMYVPPKPLSVSPAGVASEKEWSHQSEFVDSISSEELLRKAVARSPARAGLGSKGGLLRQLEDSDEEETKDDPDTLKAAVEAQTQLIAQFRSCCEIKDRSYLLRSYPKCFVGKDTVDMLVKKEIVFTRSEAVRVGNKLIDNGVISHVLNEHAFEDANLYYRFNADQSQVVRS